MVQKNLLSIFGLFTVLVLSLSLVSAAVVYTPISLEGTGDDGTTVSINLNIENTFSGDFSEITATFTDLTKTSSSTTIADSNLILSGVDSTTVILGSEDLDVSVEIQIPSGQAAGTYEGELELFGKIGGGEVLSRGTVPITLTVTQSTPTDQPEEIQECTLTGGVVGDAELSVKIEDINVKEGFGDDDEYWYLFDEIEVEIEVDNKGDWDLEDIEIEWGLYNTDVGDFIIDDKENDFNLDEDDDEETITISFKLDKRINKYQNGDTVLYVWANGKIDDNNAGVHDGDDICASDSTEIEIRTGDKFVIADKIEVPESVSCGEKVTVTFEVQNIGDDNQDEVLVVISNAELGIEKRIEVGDLGDFEGEEFTTFLDIPQDAEEKIYYLQFEVYDEDGDIFENEEDDKAKFIAPIKILGSCGVSSQPTITANLASDAKVDENLIIQVSVTNPGEATDFIVTPAGFESWASLVSVEPSVLNIPEQGTKQILITLNPTKSGTQTFNIKAVYNGQTVEQPVTVTIAEKTGTLTGAFSGVGDTGLYIISAVVLILIIIIIALIVKVSRAPSAAEF